MTSEEIHGIPPQPPPTCPMIDESIEIVKSAIHKAREAHSTFRDPDSFAESMCDIERELSQLVGISGPAVLEKARQNTVEIRAWGQAWKEKAKKDNKTC